MAKKIGIMDTKLASLMNSTMPNRKHLQNKPDISSFSRSVKLSINCCSNISDSRHLLEKKSYNSYRNEVPEV